MLPETVFIQMLFLGWVDRKKEVPKEIELEINGISGGEVFMKKYKLVGDFNAQRVEMFALNTNRKLSKKENRICLFFRPERNELFSTDTP